MLLRVEWGLWWIMKNSVPLQQQHAKEKDPTNTNCPISGSRLLLILRGAHEIVTSEGAVPVRSNARRRIGIIVIVCIRVRIGILRVGSRCRINFFGIHR
jgi:hypothetical protein